MAFKSYKGSIRMASGLIPEAKGYPLMQSCDIQVAEDGTNLEDFLNEMHKLVPLTQEQYNALVSAGNIDKNALYLIIEEG